MHDHTRPRHPRKVPRKMRSTRRSGRATNPHTEGVPTPRTSHENPKDPTAHIRSLNHENDAHQELYDRARQTSDTADRARRDATLARTNAQVAREAYLTSRAEDPSRHAPLMRQLAIASGTLCLDAVACYFAAEALGDDQIQTGLWAGLFLAALGTAEIALDRYAERSRKSWRLVATGLFLFVLGLAILRFVYFDIVGTGGPIAAAVGACLFSAFTLGFVAAGYRALRAAETIQTWKAHHRNRQANKEADRRAATAARLAADRDRLADAYVARIRARLLLSCTDAELPAMEQAVRRHLVGGQS
jgi:hypothetical protein